MASTCEQVRELLPAYEDGDLAPEEGRRLERHLAGCRTCQAVLEGLARAWEGLADWPSIDPAPAWNQSFWRALGREEERRRLGRLRLLLAPPWGSAALVAVMALGFVGGTLWQRPVPPLGRATSQVLSRSVAQVLVAPLGSFPAPGPDRKSTRAPAGPAARDR